MHNFCSRLSIEVEQMVNKTLVRCYQSAIQICFKLSFITLNFACKDCKVFYWDKLYAISNVGGNRCKCMHRLKYNVSQVQVKRKDYYHNWDYLDWTCLTVPLLWKTKLVLQWKSECSICTLSSAISNTGVDKSQKIYSFIQLSQ